MAITFYMLLKQYFNHNIQTQHSENNQKNFKESRLFKLQTYERMALFCERISIPNLIMRLKNSKMEPLDLQSAILISIQKEYEHNVAQQIYISENLWNIIEFSKNNMLSIMADTKVSMDMNTYTSDLLNAYNSQKINAIDAAISAIRKETHLAI